MKYHQTRSILVGFLVLGLLLSGISAEITDASKLSESCKIDDDCSPPQIICGTEGKDKQKCVHKKLFPMNLYDIIGLVVLIIMLMISIIVGISGGSIIVPVLVFLVGTDTTQAVAISNAIILLTSGIKYCLGLTKKNPVEGYRTIVDYNAAMMMIPTMTLFSTIGSMVGSFLPSVLVMLLLVLVVLPSWYFGFKNFRKVRANERKNKELEAQKAKESVSGDGKTQAVSSDPPEIKTAEKSALNGKDELKEGDSQTPIHKRISTFESIPEESFPNEPGMTASLTASAMKYKIRHPVKQLVTPKKEQINPTKDEELSLEVKPLNFSSPQKKPEVELSNEPAFSPEILAQRRIEGSNFYLKKFGPILICACLGVVFALFKGGKGTDSVIGIERCSTMEWVLLGVYGSLMLLVAFLGGCIVSKEVARKKSLGWKWGPAEVIFTRGKIIGLSAYCCFVGLIGTLVGLGGGIPLNPFLVAFGFMPITTSWTININTFVSKIAAVVIYAVSGNLLLDYTLFYGGLITVAMLISETFILKWVKKKGSQVFYPLFFLVILSISIVMVFYVGIDTWLEKKRKNEPVWVFSSYCDKK